MKIRSSARTILWGLILLGLSVSACGTFPGLSRRGGGGTLLVAEVKSDAADAEASMDRAVKIFQNRLNAFGADAEVKKMSADRVEIKLYGVADDDIERIKALLESQGKFELKKVVTPPSPAPLQTYQTRQSAITELGGAVPENRQVLPYPEPAATGLGEQRYIMQWIIVEHPAVIDSADLRDVSAHPNSFGDGTYQIQFSLTPPGAQKFGDWTGKNINNHLAIVLNDEVKSIPYIRSQIFDQGEIDGRFTKESAEDLALVMKNGQLGAVVKIVEEKKFQ